MKRRPVHLFSSACRFSNSIEVFKSLISHVAFPILSLSSFIWFLVRVIPKPNRSTRRFIYVTSPLASGFVHLIGVGTSGSALQRARKSITEVWCLIAMFFVTVGLLLSAFTLVYPEDLTRAWMHDCLEYNAGSSVTALPRNYPDLRTTFSYPFFPWLSFILPEDAGSNWSPAGIALPDSQPPNEPIGVPRGIYPGRVVWVWDPDATNENCTLQYNGDGIANEDDDGWFLDKNNDQDLIDRMLAAAVRNLTGKSTVADAWDALFIYFNWRKYGLENTGYTPGEKIFIKINATSAWGYGLPGGNITDDYNKRENEFYSISETSPQIVLSTLRQLVNQCGIAEEDISVGDPMRYLYNHCYDKWAAEFPNVNYIAHTAGGGRQGVVPTTVPVIFYSDRGTVLPVTDDYIYTVMNDADYMINIPQMKAHARAGITLFAKNHFGSQTRDNAQHLHNGLVAPDGINPTRTDYGMYRVQVDMMGHERIGQNTVLYLLDALWAGSEATDPPTKWDLAPFNGDWTSSIFVSQDIVAIESVAYDFLRSEYDGQGGKVNYPNMGAVDDYLHQAADSTRWPAGIAYDPEGDGSQIPSLGVHEHWNNPEDKKYSRNLGIGNGIELIAIEDLPDVEWDKQEPISHP